MIDEYTSRGDYHRRLDKNWVYYPVYVTKMELVRAFLSKLPKDVSILDVGCGEGLLVEEFRAKGYNIVGVDLNYESQYVMRGDIRKMNFDKGSWDFVLCLDVLEHLYPVDQEQAVAEIHRILKPDGRLFTVIPNLAHFASRLSFLLTGNLIRTSTIDRHIGDRPIHEYLELLRHQFDVVERQGLFPTYPIISLLTFYFPDKVIWLHQLFNTTLAYPDFCFLNALVCKPLFATKLAALSKV